MVEAATTTEPVVSVAEDTAKTLDIHPGRSIEMGVSGRTIKVARRRRAHDIEGMRGTAPSEFVFEIRRPWPDCRWCSTEACA